MAGDRTGVARPARRRATRSSRRARRRRWSWAGRLKALAFGALALAALPQAGDYAMSLRPVAGCRVTQVIDGDTVALACPGEAPGRVRLLGFDTPEVFSPGCAAEALAGALATQKLRSLVWTGGRIEAIFRGHDRYGRRLAELQIDGTGVAQTMIASGHARPYDGAARDGWCG